MELTPTRRGILRRQELALVLVDEAFGGGPLKRLQMIITIAPKTRIAAHPRITMSTSRAGIGGEAR